MYINNQQIWKPNGLYTRKPYNSDIFKGAIPENKWVFNCEVYDYEKLPDEITEAPLSKPF